MKNLTLTENCKISHYQECVRRKSTSEYRFYKDLELNPSYVYENLNQAHSKGQIDIQNINGNRFGEDEDQRCSLWNFNTVEDIPHFTISNKFLSDTSLISSTSSFTNL